MKQDMPLRPNRAGHTLLLRLPRRTIRVRLALQFFAVFLASGTVLLVVTFAIWQDRTNALQATPTPGGREQITPVSSNAHQLLIASGIALVLMAGASLVIGWLVAGRFLKPVRMITVTTQAISATSLHERLNLNGPNDELKELADTFDQLLDRLEHSFAFEREFVANASHELRTPLAGMRTSLEVAMAKPGPLPPHIRTLADRLDRELDHVDRLLESFLALAQTQHGPPGDESTVSLAELVRLAIQRPADTISAMNLHVEHQGPDVWVTGPETLFSRLVENVVNNAVGHNLPGGWVRVITAERAGRAYLVVENGGPVLHPDQVKQLTRPFQRIGAERTGSDSGSGLGLSIVSSILEVHGGTLDLQALANGGLRVAISLPLAVRTSTWAQT